MNHHNHDRMIYLNNPQRLGTRIMLLGSLGITAGITVAIIIAFWK